MNLQMGQFFLSTLNLISYLFELYNVCKLLQKFNSY